MRIQTMWLVWAMSALVAASSCQVIIGLEDTELAPDAAPMVDAPMADAPVVDAPPARYRVLVAAAGIIESVSVRLLAMGICSA